MNMGKAVACIGPTAMSVTGGAETAIGTSWQVPAGTKAILGVRITTAAGTVHDAVLSVIPALRIYSPDLKIEPCDILAEPQGLSPVTSGRGNSMRDSRFYKLNIPCNGGETIYFYGRHMVTVTTASWMGINVTFSDSGPEGEQYHYKISAQVFATTVTAGAKHTDTNPYRVSGYSKITGVYGVVWQTTSTAAVGCIGKFGLESSDFKVPFALTWANEGGGGILSVGDLDVHLSAVEDLDVPISEQTTITQTFTNGPTNIVGAFITGVQFQ